MGCSCSSANAVTHPEQFCRDKLATVPEDLQTQFERALRCNWSLFDWKRDCSSLHEGSMKVVGRLKAYPKVAVASVITGVGESLIRSEVDMLKNLAAQGVRTIRLSDKILEVPCYSSEVKVKAKAFLIEYFDETTAFYYSEGEPGTDGYVQEAMRKLKLVEGDEGDWVINKDTIRVLKENGLERQFMDDLSAYVAMLLAQQKRVVDFQGLLGKDGHFYVSDPLRLESLETKVNRNLLHGVFMTSANPPRENKPRRAAFVEGLGLELGLDVPDEE
eukprot:CAMPEP_0115446618 /NCGR_PEP_ID=MMETSP0271-20121206/39542_1 /TAXON_ID=71861 /ORGANISM="Scrippsiella trochoidea, Strain CCMP3099" /LENGTH=273 /DNA_ID=CAMNT_0002872661 /DNA_START=30 /DNA_END=851 /DNA_ORIENTATION=-